MVYSHDNGTVPTTGRETAGAAITGGYMGDSFTIKVLIILFPVLSIYNALELLILIFFTFNKYRGVYFWSLLVASTGIIPYSLGFLFKFGNITVGHLRWLSVTLLTIGWWTLVTGQSVVLWSRLHLILDGTQGQSTLRWTKWMIIIDAVILHIPTTVLTWGSNGNVHTETFARAYNIMEKIQMSGFFVQEVILSSIYIVATVRILKSSVREYTYKLMWQLMLVNIIIVMDLALLGLEAASLYLLETLCKGVIYSVKLKLEFAILGQLVKFVGRPSGSVANEERMRQASVTYFGPEEMKMAKGSKIHRPESIRSGSRFFSDLGELTKTTSQNTHRSAMVSPSADDEQTDKFQRRSRADSVRLPPGMTRDELDVVMFQHTEDVSLLENTSTLEPIQESHQSTCRRRGDGADAV